MGRILTCLIRYSSQHSHFWPLHRSSRIDFAAARTLRYHRRAPRGSSNDRIRVPKKLEIGIWKLDILCEAQRSIASVVSLSPGHFRRRSSYPGGRNTDGQKTDSSKIVHVHHVCLLVRPRHPSTDAQSASFESLRVPQSLEGLSLSKGIRTLSSGKIG